MGRHELKKTWFHRALRRAGIEHESWRPGRGVDENRRVVEAVYSYYGGLFLEYPCLLWAGMASMIGPAFYAGFRDLGFMPDAVRKTVIAVFGRASRRLAHSAAGAASRVWMNPGREPVDPAVSLPGGRIYHALADMAVMLSPAGTGEPDWLAVQLPAADLDATGQLVAEYAAAWGLPPEEVASWRAGAAPSAPAGPDNDTGLFAYSTPRVYRDGCWVCALGIPGLPPPA